MNQVSLNVCCSGNSAYDEVKRLIENQTVFRAGQLTSAVHSWCEITNDPTIIQFVKGVFLEFTQNCEPTQISARPSIFNSREQLIVHEEINKLLQKGVIKESHNEHGEFISPIFLRAKPDGSYRTILNLKTFNEFVEYHHFKMDTLESAIRIIKPDCYMASIDLKDAYYTVAIAEEHQKYLKFLFDGKLYQYTCLPNGLSSAPRIFTKLLKPAYAYLHNLGHLSLGYIDDSYLQGDTYGECMQNIKDTVMLFNKLGFHLHPLKSVVIPTKRLTFLGFNLDSGSMTVSPTEQKVLKTLKSCKKLKAKQNPLISEVAEVIGILVSNFPGTQFGQLYYRSLEYDKTNALICSKGNYNAHMKLSPRSMIELDWWISNMPVACKNIQPLKANIQLQTDASNKGWGAVYGDQQIGGRWNTNEAMDHINILELKAAFFALKSFCSQANKTHVQIQIDNTTAVSYINNMGGSKSPVLNTLAIELWEWCIHRNIWVSAVHIAGKLNVDADFKSRSFSDKHEWMLNRNVFTEILTEFPELNMDLFASRLTSQLTQYCSWQPDPGSAFVDAFSIDWSKFNFYAFPPFSLIPRCLQKIQQDKGKGILIVPVWPTQTWFPLVLQLLYSQPWICQPSPKLLQHTTHNRLHPLHQKLHLMVCPLSGTLSDNTTFLKRSSKSSWLHGGRAPRNNIQRTSINGWSFVVRGQLITVHQR